MTRTVEKQIIINENLMLSNMKKLQTSLNNFREGRGHTPYMRLQHVQDDCLSVALAIEKVFLLQMMRDTDDNDHIYPGTTPEAT